MHMMSNVRNEQNFQGARHELSRLGVDKRAERVVLLLRLDVRLHRLPRPLEDVFPKKCHLVSVDISVEASVHDRWNDDKVLWFIFSSHTPWEDVIDVVLPVDTRWNRFSENKLLSEPSERWVTPLLLPVDFVPQDDVR